MYYDPYDEEVQVKFHRTDQTGRIVRLDTGDEELCADMIEVIGAIVAVVVLALTAWWLI